MGGSLHRRPCGERPCCTGPLLCYDGCVDRPTPRRWPCATGRKACMGARQRIPASSNRARATLLYYVIFANFGNPALSYRRSPMNPHLLTLLIFIPLAAALLMAFIPAGKKAIYKYVALFTGILQ